MMVNFNEVPVLSEGHNSLIYLCSVNGMPKMLVEVGNDGCNQL